MRILCTGDVHIGRRSTRLPTHLDGHAHSCGAAWLRVTERALREEVDLLVVTGDVIDEANRYFEAVGTLERGLRRLAAAGIPAVFVAGNHDHDVLPRVIDSLPPGSARLLGRGGRWERWSFERRGSRVHLDGWSFPHAAVRTPPLATYAPHLDGDPVLTLLHGDLDQPRSRYGPIARTDLGRFPGVVFLLGHIHTPWLVEEADGSRFLYPGSPQAMDPGEAGPHGAWLVELGRGTVQFRHLPLSSVRYDSLDVHVDDLADLDELEARVVAVVREGLRSCVEESQAVRCVRYRIRLTGRSGRQREIITRLSEVGEDLELPEGEAIATIESVVAAMDTSHDLEALGRGIGAPATLAQLLAGDRLPTALMVELRKLVTEVHSSRLFAEVGIDEELDDLEAWSADELRRAGMALLDELLAQKSATP